jgi:hypothetical protein
VKDLGSLVVDAAEVGEDSVREGLVVDSRSEERGRRSEDVGVQAVGSRSEPDMAAKEGGEIGGDRGG